MAPNANSGKSLVSLGVLQMVMRNTANVGYFKPIVEKKSKKDKFVETVLSHFNLNMQYEDAHVYTRKEAVALKNEGSIGEVYDTIIKRYKELEAKFDFVLVDSASIGEDSNPFDESLNASIAQSLNIPTLVVLNDAYASEEELIEQVQVELHNLLEKDVRVLSVFINKAKNATAETKTRLEAIFKDIPVTIIEEREELSRPTIREVAEA